MMRILSVTEQVARLRELFPELAGATFDEVMEYRTLPKKVDGWFAVPRWEALGATYNQALYRVFDCMCQMLGEKFRLEIDQGERVDRLRLRECDARFLEKIGREQAGHNILILPIQLGAARQYEDPDSARVNVANSQTEFCAGTYLIGMCLLTHIHWLSEGDDSIDCPGDEYDGERRGRFEETLGYFWRKGVLTVNAECGVGFSPSNLPATGFVPSEMACA